jgi:hypothetical protein
MKMKDKLRQIVIDLDSEGHLLDVSYFFHDSSEPFSITEFVSGGETKNFMENFESGLIPLLEGKTN